MWKDIKAIFFDFDGVFTDNNVYVTEDGQESVRCSRLDGIGLSKLRLIGVPTAIISTEKNKVVSMRAKKLKVDCYQDVRNKQEVLDELCHKHKLARKDIAFLGNDVNDLEVLEVVGFPMVVSDAHADVRDVARYITINRGGYGAVREVCDLIDKSRNEVKGNIS